MTEHRYIHPRCGAWTGTVGIRVTPKNPKNADLAMQLEAVLNYIIEHDTKTQKMLNDVHEAALSQAIEKELFG